jgi:hypothetical protein
MSEDVIRRCDFKIRDGRKYRKCDKQIPDNAPTVFSIGEFAYKADLCAEDRMKLEEVLAPFIEIAEGYTQVGKSVRQLLRTVNGQATQSDMRAWARKNTKFDIAPTGALKQEVIDAYNAAHA